MRYWIHKARAEMTAPYQGPWTTIDTIALLGVFAIGSALSLTLFGRIDEILLDFRFIDFWFDGDTPRFVANLSDTATSYYRASVHPLYPLLLATPSLIAINGLGVSPRSAVAAVMALGSGLVGAAFFALLRFARLPRLDASVYTALLLCSAGFLFWAAAPDTYMWGALSIVAPLVVLMASPSAGPPWLMAVASALSLSITVTNWMAGLAATFLSRPREEAIRLTGCAFAVVALLVVTQRTIYPSAGVGGLYNEADYLAFKESSYSPLRVARTFFLSSIELPQPATKTIKRQGLYTTTTGVADFSEFRILSVQESQLTAMSAGQLATAAAWLVLLGIGVWGALAAPAPRRLSLVVGTILLGQLLLHLFYGSETFLYAAHFVPLLVATAAFASWTPLRRPALLLAVFVAIAAGVNNFGQFDRSLAMLAAEADDLFLGGARDTVRAAMAMRPDDPWPRGRGHLPWGLPGTREIDKSYLEPGGSFSPSVGSFGIAIWVVDAEGKLHTTGDQLPIEAIRQSFRWDGGIVPAVVTQTDFYQAVWELVAAEHWRLRLTPLDGSHLAVAVRSVGPAGGPLRVVERRDDALRLNQRWRIEAKPVLDVAYLGREGVAGWTGIVKNPPPARAVANDGWAHARLRVDPIQGLTLDVIDTQGPPVTSPLAAIAARAAVRLELPDRRFVAAFDSQVAQQMMGLVGVETRPGDPWEYPLAWQRDGAYTVVALTRAGRLDAARQLITKFATEDFFGGFGAEADAPGLALWAIEEVSQAAADPAVDVALWPHVKRKADLILQLASPRLWSGGEASLSETSSPPQPTLVDRLASLPRLFLQPDGREEDFTGGTVPGAWMRELSEHLVARPPKDGLIVGRMDWQFPLLFVNAVSYRGLEDAAAFAERMSHEQDAQRWRETAGRLRQAWERTLHSSSAERANPRTTASGLWPTFAAPDRRAFRDVLEAAWSSDRDSSGGFRGYPRWTYFDLAQAHQWLYLGRPDRVWSTLEWFWKASPAPGLYTLWEGSGDGAFKLWRGVRGWIAPTHITPHYWASAEMLLLQAAMLAYIDPERDGGTLVVGAGVPAQWLTTPLTVAGLFTRAGRVDWTWNDGVLRVTVDRPPAHVVPGPAFPEGARLEVARPSESERRERDPL